MTHSIKTKIPISELSVGMLVTGVDRPWYATPFLSHRMTITSESEIATLKACGVKLVEIEVGEPSAGEQSTALTASNPTKESGEVATGTELRDSPPVSSGVLRQGSTSPNRSASGREASASPQRYPSAARLKPSDHEEVSPSSDFPATSFEEELQAAQAGYDDAKAAVQRALDHAKMGHAFEGSAVSKAVGSLADSIIRNPMALASLSRLKSLDEYTYYHSVNTCILAMALGRQLRMSREVLQTLGMGMLLHDIGKTRLPADLLGKTGPLGADDIEVMKQHVLRGVEFLTEVMKLSGDVLLPVLEHHERMDGSGYPHGKKRPELSEFGLISSVVDVYDALTSDRHYRKAVSPHQALQTLYDLARRTQLDAACVERFIRCMGIYPVGSCVKLSSGEIGIVAKVNPTQTLNPVIFIVRESPTGALLKPQPLDLALQSGKGVKRITEVLHPSTAGVVPNEVLDAALKRTPARIAA